MQSGQVVGIGSADMFDTTSHTQGGLPHLVQHLWDQYCLHLAAEIQKRKEAGQPALDLDAAKRRAPAAGFCKWATAYLLENRVAEGFFIDANHGVRLTNNVAVALCPGLQDDIRGTMQDSKAVQVTEGRSQAHQQGVVAPDAGAFRL